MESPELRDFLWDYLERILADNVKARRLLPDGSYVPAGTARASRSMSSSTIWIIRRS